MNSTKLLVIANNITSTKEFEFEFEETNNPVLRKCKILESIDKYVSETTVIHVDECIDVEWLSLVHDKDYLTFLHKSYKSFVNSKDTSWANLDQGLVPFNFHKGFNRISPNIPLYKLAGLYGSDTTTPIYDDTWNNAMVSANQAYIAASIVSSSNVVYVLATSPGHHAKRAEYGGYCFINNGIVAAKRLIELGKSKVAVLDLDYHAGNGSYTFADDKIVTYSIHCDPVYEYPSFEGYADDYNYVLEPHCDWDKYKSILSIVCERIISDRVESIIIAFGGDTFKSDPDALLIGRFQLELSCYREMGRMIKNYFSKVPIIITQEGGYDMENIGDIVSLFLAGLIE